MIGAELGYRYAGSPLIWPETGSRPRTSSLATSRPRSRARGCRMSGSTTAAPLQDRIGDGYTLLRLGGSSADASALARAFGAIGAPFTTLDIPDAAARALYGRDLILLRPDLHVVWRGNRPPEEPERLARMATGH